MISIVAASRANNQASTNGTVVRAPYDAFERRAFQILWAKFLMVAASLADILAPTSGTLSRYAYGALARTPGAANSSSFAPPCSNFSKFTNKNRAAFHILFAKFRELCMRSSVQITSLTDAVTASVKRIASVPYFWFTSIGSIPVPFDFDIFSPSGVRTIEWR